MSTPLNLTPYNKTPRWVSGLIKELQKVPDGYVVELTGSWDETAALIVRKPDGSDKQVIAICDYSLGFT